MKLSNQHILYLSFFMLFSIVLKAQEVQRLNLEEATEIALQNNKLLQIQQEKVRESEYKIKAVSAKGKPQLFASGTYLHFFEENNFVIPAGGIGSILDVPIPWDDYTLYHGNQDIFTAGVLGYQPITQLFRVNNGVKAAKAQVETDRFKTTKASLEIQAGVEKLFYAIKIQERKIAETKQKLRLPKQKYTTPKALFSPEKQNGLNLWEPKQI